MPLGLFPNASYTAETEIIPPGGALLLFTDGLPDSIAGDDGEDQVRQAVSETPGDTMQFLKSMVKPEFNEDDVTIVLVRRKTDAAVS